ncbi:MAG: hypothetical protein ACJAXA_002407 [Candidatus Aldehydirespiratoraceae bacterium]
MVHGDRVVTEPFEERRDRDPNFQAGERCTEAAVGAESE